MYCPKCGQSRTNEHTRYCSRCGFLISGVEEFVRRGGQMTNLVVQTDPNAVSPKIRGLKQGGIMFLSGVLIVPLLAIIIGGILGTEPILAGVAAIVFFLGGILRMIYALLFQPHVRTTSEKAGFIASLKQIFLSQPVVEHDPQRSLNEPMMTDFPNASMNWRETGEFETMPRNDKSTSTLGPR